jgi:peptidoglycan lytic transglycosylase
VEDVAAMRKSRARWRLMAAVAIVTGVAGCSTYRAPAPAVPPPQAAAIAPQGGTIIGVASWYGPGFNGHRTSSGEIYNQEDLTAASTLYPLGSRVIVTNLDNDRSVEVRINDHGPYVKERKIDLSKKAARMIGMIGPGTAPVRIDLLSAPAGSRPVGAPTIYFVQVGSFSNPANASHLQQRLAAHYRDVSVDPVDAGGQTFYRVRMGAFESRASAQSRAAETARFGLPVVIVSE